MLNHVTDVQGIVQDGLAKGKSYKDIAKTLSQQKDITVKKAEFWARDQAKNFYSEQTMLRQKEADFTGFIWRNQKDSKVRDFHRGKSHGGPADQFWRWDNLPWVNRKGVGPAQLKPGDDWNCRCWAEPAWEPEGKDQEPSPELLRPQSSEQRISPAFRNYVEEIPSQQQIVVIINAILDFEKTIFTPSTKTKTRIRPMVVGKASKGFIGKYDPLHSL